MYCFNTSTLSNIFDGILMSRRALTNPSFCFH
uniref:Uncharacterized protein n=1 Tax=Medicago truncatula TaxID=3880 RepID=B7FKA7_MEDTR|nr:unknown [Medicago truncatula]